MQTKIIFVLLFILSFNIMHDTVIHITDHNEPLSVSEYVDTQITLHEFIDLDDLHSIFHFDAVERAVFREEAYVQTAHLFIDDLLQNTPPPLQRNTKPPIT